MNESEGRALVRFDEVNPPISEMPQRAARVEWQGRRAVHGAIRNILFNELGWSKEGTQSLFTKIVRESAEARIKNYGDDGLRDYIDRHVLDRAFRWSGDLEKLVKKTVEKTVEAVVRERVLAALGDTLEIQVSVKTKPATGE